MTMAKKSDRYRRMTMRELVPFVDQYYEQFPGWKRIDDDAFGREAGPIAQEIFFERLSYGTYRPMSYIRIFAAPNGGAFHQYLRSVTTIEPRAHANKFGRVVEGFHKELIPSVDATLVPIDVLRLYEKQERHNPPDAQYLAALSADLGHEERALYWCEEFPKLVDARGHNAWQDYDYERLAFLKQLEQWIKNGEAKPRLEEVIQSERKRLKYA